MEKVVEMAKKKKKVEEKSADTAVEGERKEVIGVAEADES